MEENVALDSSKQKQFVKSIKGIKKLIKKKDPEGVVKKIVKSKGKDGKVKKDTRRPRGLVYLGHIPHGFYENEMTQYFRQFGRVTNARVIRSKRTGNSKGHAFVEFKEPAVAEIVAETMNNYLMGKRLIKAAYIPPEQQKRFAMRKHWSAVHNPGVERKLKMKKAYNVDKDENDELKRARKSLSNISKTKKKLSALGINYDFFAPVDVPEPLLESAPKPKVKQEKSKVKVEDSKSKKAVKQEKAEEVKKAKEVKKTKELKKPDDKKKEIKVMEKQKEIKVMEKQKEIKIFEKKNEIKVIKNKKGKVNEKEQKQKEQKLKGAGVKSVENFIKVQNDSDGESDSPYEFDSDEFEKMLQKEDEDSDQENEDSDVEIEDSDEKNDSDDESEEKKPPPTKHIKKNIKPAQIASQAAETKKQVANQAKLVVPQNKFKNKRKTSQKAPAPIDAKKSKFENKSTQKLAKKQFKKKK